MTEEDRKYVDGCAIFYRTSKYVIHYFFIHWLCKGESHSSHASFIVKLS